MIGAMVWIGNLKSPLIGYRDLDKLALSRTYVGLYGRVRANRSGVGSVRLRAKRKPPANVGLTEG